VVLPELGFVIARAIPTVPSQIIPSNDVLRSVRLVVCLRKRYQLPMISAPADTVKEVRRFTKGI